MGDKELPGKSFLMKYHLFWPHVPAVLVPAWRFGFKSQYFVSVPIGNDCHLDQNPQNDVETSHLSPTEMRKPTSRPFSHTPFIFSSPLTITPWQPQSEVNMTKSLKNGRKGYKEPHKPTFHLRRTQWIFYPLNFMFGKYFARIQPWVKIHKSAFYPKIPIPPNQLQNPPSLKGFLKSCFPKKFSMIWNVCGVCVEERKWSITFPCLNPLTNSPSYVSLPDLVVIVIIILWSSAALVKTWELRFRPPCHICNPPHRFSLSWNID